MLIPGGIKKGNLINYMNSEIISFLESLEEKKNNMKRINGFHKKNVTKQTS